MNPVRLALTSLERRDTPATLPTNFSETLLGDGVAGGTALTVAPNGDVWVLEQAGGVKRFRTGVSTADTVATIAADSLGERGVLGLAFDPNFAANKFVYVFYTVPASGAIAPFNRVSRFTVNDSNPADYSFVANSEFVLVDLDPVGPFSNHNAGDLHFGTDGKLYISVGDNNASATSQSLTTRHGKILRLNPDGTIPADNPTTFDGISGSTSGANRAIYAVGFRNPYRMAVRAGSGQIFVNDVGAGAFEEVNELRAGANYGWPLTEGPTPANFLGVTYPVYSYANGSGPMEGRAVGGAAFYTPDAANFPPEYKGDYFFTEIGISRIYVRDAVSGRVSTFAESTGLALDLDTLPDGRLAYLSRGAGKVMAIQYNPPTAFITGLSAAGTGAGTAARVAVRNADGSARFTLSPFDGFAGGVTVGVGDVTGDGSDDIVIGAGAGGGPHVKVFDGLSGQEVRSFFAFDPQFRGGVSVATGDTDGDGREEIVVGAGAGGGPHVKVFNATGEAKSFFAFAPNFSGGASVAAGDLDGDGQAEIVAAAGPGGGPHVRAFRASDLAEVRSFFAFDASYTGGVNVAAGDLDGDRRDDIAAGPKSGGSAVVNVFRGGSTTSVAAFAPTFGGGVRVGIGSGILFVGAGVGGGPHVRGLSGRSLSEVRSEFAFDPTFTGGVWVG